MTVEHDDPEALRLAMLALGRAYLRHVAARRDRVLVDAFASAAEAVWWICAVDDQLGGVGPPRTPYADARDDDEDGRYIPGLRWVRDRHTHQLPITTDEDRTPFFGSGKGVIYISPGFIWRATEEIRENPKRRAGRDVYDSLISGRKSTGPLASACRWLRGWTRLDLGPGVSIT